MMVTTGMNRHAELTLPSGKTIPVKVCAYDEENHEYLVEYPPDMELPDAWVSADRIQLEEED